jgi:hypothetical protein
VGRNLADAAEKSPAFKGLADEVKGGGGNRTRERKFGVIMTYVMSDGEHS